MAELAAIDRCRTYRATVDGKELRILRGEFHRHTEISGDFNSAYTVKVSSHHSGGPAAVPLDNDMTMNATWIGPCKAGQKAGDIIMPGGLKMNIKDMQKLRALIPQH